MNVMKKTRAYSTVVTLNKLFFGALALLFVWARYDTKNSSAEVPLGDILVFYIALLLIASLVFGSFTHMILLLKINDKNAPFWTLSSLFLANFLAMLSFCFFLFFAQPFFLFAVPIAFVLPFAICVFVASD